jgi:glycosyltransferase involved in cell wall biosynthesis
VTVSTIIPTYNRADLVGRAIISALRQSEPGDEVIVVDDGSTDGTEQVVVQYLDRIKYIRLPHSGAGVARNRGVRKAQNDLIAFLDSDDEWMPGKLALQRNFMRKRPDILFCFSDFAVKNELGKEEHHYLANWHKDKRTWDEILGPGVYYSTYSSLSPNYDDFRIHVGNIYTSELTANYIFTGTLMVRRREAGETLHFGEGLPTFEDWECFGRLARKGPAAYFDCETAWQMSHTGSRLTQSDSLNTALARIALMQRVWGDDTEFLKEQSNLYYRTLNEQRLQKIRGLIKEGETKEARQEIKGVNSAPLSYRLMASLPSPLVTGLLRMRNLLLRKS